MHDFVCRIFWPALAIPLLYSCSSPVLTMREKCPVPVVPICSAAPFNKTTLDTTRPASGQYWYHIHELEAPFNSAANDNSISLARVNGSNLFLVSSDRSTSQGLHPVLLTQGSVKEFDRVSCDLNLFPMGCASYSPEENKIYFAAKAANIDPDDYDLYEGVLTRTIDNFELTHIQRLDKLSLSGSFDSQPSISSDGKVIYFVSDRPGGMGGTDIWYSTRDAISDAWTAPRDLGPEVNTPCDELSPYVTSNSSHLYFSSNGRESVGGYDIFVADRSTGIAWSNAHNVGKPINTVYDELFPVVPDDTSFYFTSDEPATNAGRNIFSVTREIYQAPISEVQPREVVPEHMVHVTGRVTDSHGHVPDSAQVFVRDDRTGKEIIRKPLEDSGKYSVSLNSKGEYDVGAEKDKKFFDVVHLTPKQLRDSALHLNLLVPDTLVLRINFPFDDYQHPYDFTIDDQGQKSDLQWQTVLDLAAQSILKSGKSLRKVVLYGHTDSLGSDEYNNSLGLNRAQFIAHELETRGVHAGILEVRSSGRTQPVLRRKDESDETFRLRCRRVEFVKVFR